MKIEAALLAGGDGERFWPLSTPERPKQFLGIFGGGKSLLRLTAERLRGLVGGPGGIFVATGARHVAATRRELPELPTANIVGEPERRDTGAAVALCAGLAGRDGGDPVLGIFPSDQTAANTAAFRAAVRRAANAANHRPDAIAVIGIKPTFPSTAYGYVDPAKGAFIEKPNAAKAKRLVAKGMLWNAGMFVARVSAFRRAFAEFAPALLPLAEGRVARRALPAFYKGLEKISFDYAVMEPLSRTGRVAVVPGDFGWDDVGGYAAFERHFPHDAAGNVTLGAVRTLDAGNCIAVAQTGRISLLGVKDVVVAVSGGEVLVAAKSHLDAMKRLAGAKTR